MISARLIVMLLTLVNGARNDNAVKPCASVRTPSPVVVLGSSVSASCVISEECRVTIGPAVGVEWRLDDLPLPRRFVTNQSTGISEVVIPNFNRTEAFLMCCVQMSPPQILGGVQIRAGYPPSAPQNLQCQTNLTIPSTLTCRWDPGQTSLLPTTYSLHSRIREPNRTFTYKMPPGLYHYPIPRSDFFLFDDMEVYVKAANELGEVSSLPVVLEPLSAARFDPPEIRSVQTVSKKYGCLRIYWNLSPNQSWLSHTMALELRIRTMDSGPQSDQSFERHGKPSRTIDQCGLFHGTRYLTQIRVRFRGGPWSEWSLSQSGVTLEKAPSGRLDSWMNVSEDHTHKNVTVNLFWKPPKQFRANGHNVSYVVSAVKTPGERGVLCVTSRMYCTFKAPGRARRVYLSALNSAGRSTPTETRIHHNKDIKAITDMTVAPLDDTSLKVRWSSVDSPSLLGFMVQWRPSLKPDPAFVQFQSASKNQSSLIISGSVEPYKPYEICVYPRFKDGVGLPWTVNAFSRQKAPSKVPKLRIEWTWQFEVELTWDEIPLYERNGVIQGYKVFYWTENGSAHVVDASPDERKLLLTDLSPLFVYEAVLMASTLGGSQNGSSIHFKTESFDMLTVVIIVTACLTGLVLICIIMFAACTKHKRLKSPFCQIIPDPANSSIKKWTTESLQDILPAFNNNEPNPDCLSHLSFLDLPSLKLNKEEDSWLNPEDTSDLGESLCGSPVIPGYCGTNSDSVTYATVIFSSQSPCSSTTPTVDHVYLRSESTQPLLEEEEAFTPKCYQNLSSQTDRGRCFFGPSHSEEMEELPDVWDQFPFLRALEMNDNGND